MMENSELFAIGEMPKKVGGFAHDRDLDYGKEEWLTPLEIITALGEFDLDPCSPVAALRPWATARRHYSVLDNGLNLPWEGRVFCNPPYGQETGKWLGRCAEHKNAIALIFARTETRQFFTHIWPRATAVCFLKGRVSFFELSCQVCGMGLSHAAHKKDSGHKPVPRNVAVKGGTSGAPSMLVAWDDGNAEAIKQANDGGLLTGAFVRLNVGG